MYIHVTDHKIEKGILPSKVNPNGKVTADILINQNMRMKAIQNLYAQLVTMDNLTVVPSDLYEAYRTGSDQAVVGDKTMSKEEVKSAIDEIVKVNRYPVFDEKDHNITNAITHLECAMMSTLKCGGPMEQGEMSEIVASLRRGETFSEVFAEPILDSDILISSEDERNLRVYTGYLDALPDEIKEGVIDHLEATGQTYDRFMSQYVKDRELTDLDKSIDLRVEELREKVDLQASRDQQEQSRSDFR